MKYAKFSEMNICQRNPWFVHFFARVLTCLLVCLTTRSNIALNAALSVDQLLEAKLGEVVKQISNSISNLCLTMLAPFVTSQSKTTLCTV